MKKKTYLVCTHPSGYKYTKISKGKIYILKDQHELDGTPFVLISDINNKKIPKNIPNEGYYLWRFKKFLDIEQAKFLSIKIKVGASTISRTCLNAGKNKYCTCL